MNMKHQNYWLNTDRSHTAAALRRYMPSDIFAAYYGAILEQDAATAARILIEWIFTEGNEQAEQLDLDIYLGCFFGREYGYLTVD